jgi:hypothetical protein
MAGAGSLSTALVIYVKGVDADLRRHDDVAPGESISTQVDITLGAVEIDVPFRRHRPVVTASQ